MWMSHPPCSPAAVRVTQPPPAGLMGTAEGRCATRDVTAESRYATIFIAPKSFRVTDSSATNRGGAASRRHTSGRESTTP